MLFGQSGNDTLLGKGGNDFLFGGADNDVLTGGDGDDQMFGESGNDRMIWNPGDDSDLMEGGAGTDTAEVNGGNGAELFTVTANGTRVRFDRLDPAPFAIDIGTSENLVVNMNGGDDTFSATGNLAALIKSRSMAAPATTRSSAATETTCCSAVPATTSSTASRATTSPSSATATTCFQWDPGDGSDTIEGQAGTDTLRFNGSGASENLRQRRRTAGGRSSPATLATS